MQTRSKSDNKITIKYASIVIRYIFSYDHAIGLPFACHRRVVDHPKLCMYRYRHLGQFAPLGGEQTAAQLPGDWVHVGHSTQWLWYSVYARYDHAL